MVKLLKSAIIITVFAGFFHNLNAQDSLRLVPVKAWMLSRLIDETKSGRICDSVLRSYIVLTESQKALLSNRDSTLKEVTLSRDTWKSTSEQKDTLRANDKKIHDIDLRLAKKKGFKKGVFVSAAVFTAYQVGKFLLSR